MINNNYFDKNYLKNLVISKGVGHQREMLGEDMERPFVKKESGFKLTSAPAGKLEVQPPGAGAPRHTHLGH